MQTKPKSNSVITHSLREDGKIEFNVLGVGTIVYDPSKASQANRDRAAIHGFVQRISDAAAIPFNKTEARYATAREKHDAMAELVEFYESGTADWKRTGGGGSTKVDGETQLIVRAIAELYGRDVKDQREMLEAVAKKRELSVKDYCKSVFSTALAANGVGPFGKLPAIIERLRAEQAKPAALDPDELAAELAGDEEGMFTQEDADKLGEIDGDKFADALEADDEPKHED